MENKIVRWLGRIKNKPIETIWNWGGVSLACLFVSSCVEAVGQTKGYIGNDFDNPVFHEVWAVDTPAYPDTPEGWEKCKQEWGNESNDSVRRDDETNITYVTIIIAPIILKVIKYILMIEAC
jgi:hypothetical protein